MKQLFLILFSFILLTASAQDWNIPKVGDGGWEVEQEFTLNKKSRNILLISVKERTKELGVRRALGATPSEVRNQIILESVFLTVIAGILGIILGAFVLAGINVATQDMTDFPYTNPTVPIPFVLGALFIMVSLGTLIGLIPAQRAVSIKPIDALREE